MVTNNNNNLLFSTLFTALQIIRLVSEDVFLIANLQMPAMFFLVSRLQLATMMKKMFDYIMMRFIIARIRLLIPFRAIIHHVPTKF